MKRGLKGVLLGTAIWSAALAAPLSSFAASTEAMPTSSSIALENTSINYRAAAMNDSKFASVRDLANALGAHIYADGNSNFLIVTKGNHYVQLTTGLSTAWVNGTSKDLHKAPMLVNGSLFMEINDLTGILEADVFTDSVSGVLKLSSEPLLDASNVNPSWIDASNLVVAHVTETGSQYYKLNINTRKSDVLVKDLKAINLTVSPDGTKVAYTNDLGVIFVENIASGDVTQVSPDESLKLELQWSASGDKLFFLQNKEADVIASISIADGTITPLVADKVQNKQDLHVSADGKKFLYFVATAGTLTSDSTQTVEKDAVTVDNTKTDPQLNYIDITAAGAKAVALTTTLENKTASSMSPDGRMIYISSETDKSSVLKAVGLDKTVTTLVSDLEVMQSTVVNGKIMILAADATGKKAIYEVNPADGTKTKLYDVNNNVTDFVFSTDGKQLVATVSDSANNRLSTYQSGMFYDLTK